MKPQAATWAAIFAAGALVTASPKSFAQEPNPQTAASTPSATEQSSPQDHLRQADALLASVSSSSSVTGRAKTRITELKQHISALQRLSASAAAVSGAESSAKASTAARTASAGKKTWSTEVAAADRILSELLADAPSAGATTPDASATTEARPTGTSGTSAAKAAAINLDEETRGKLMQVRTQLTAFAAAMSGTAPPSSAATTSSASTASSPASAAPSPTSPTTEPASTAPTSTTSSSPTSSPTEPSNPPSQPPATQPTPPAGTSPAPAAQGRGDEDAAKRALTAARDTLSQMTQLPAAAQLTGDTRTQISQLIAAFNELITTSSEWRASYAKVDTTVTKLIGSETSDESAATPTAGTAGAVGTSGTATGSLDPAIKAKLVEFRTHLKEFERAAGGADPSASAAPSAAAGPSATASGYSSGLSSPRATSSPSSAPTSAGTETARKGNDDAMRHLQAIEAILSGSASAAGSSRPTEGAASTATSLNRTQIEELKTHVTELKRLLAEAR
jgi:hypothetical protein